MLQRLIYILLAIINFDLAVTAQPQLKHRLIFIGDAGEINPKQQAIITAAAGKVLPEKTSVFYLGDNIYPRGMNMERDNAVIEDQQILRSQFEPFRSKNVPVYFIPGNHDWDRMGKKGLEKIRAQNDFIAAQKDSLLQMIPKNGCPDPIAIPFGDEAVVIAYDSEWWLFPYKKKRSDDICECDTEQDVLDQLATLLWEHKNKIIFLASHHPFQSYGEHGGKFSLKEHIFPLTALNPHIYIPLPVVGSLYPLLRKTVFINAEDIPHPQYQHFIKQITSTIDGFANVIKVAGHEHSLQLINDNGLQIVSGGGSKSTHVKKAARSLFAHAGEGFVIVDIFNDKTSEIEFYTYQHSGTLQPTYKHTTKFIDQEQIINAQYEYLLNNDSVSIAANPKYDKVGKLHRKIFGENYRKEWAAPTKLPVFRLSQLQGGLTPLQKGGGMQTVSLRLADTSGKQWVLRSVNKVADAILPEGLRSTFATKLVDDYMSGQHPYAALIIPPLADAVKVPHANPVIGVVAPDPNLSIYSNLMTGRIALLEEREPLGKSDNSEKFIKALIKDNDNTFKAKTFFRAMMLDALVSDWDRHEDQWRWRNVSNGKDKDYTPVPRDRDQALKINNGFIPKLLSRSWLLPTFQGFDSIIPSIKYSLFKHRFIQPFPEFQFSRTEWNHMATDFVQKITDSVIDVAINQLPESSRNIRGQELAEKMKKRRDQLPAAMDKYYTFSQQIVDLRLSDKHEYIVLEDAPNGGLHFTIRKINKEGLIKSKLLDHVYDPKITKEIRLYTGAGKDTLKIDYSNSPIKLRIIGGQGDKHMIITQPGKKIRLYNHTKGMSYEGYEQRIRKRLHDDSLQTAFVPVNLYSYTMPLITGGYNIDDGLILGAGFRHVHQKGFRKQPYSSSLQLVVSGALSTGALQAKLKADWIEVFRKTDIELRAFTYAPHNTHNFFGIGNDTEYDKNHPIQYYRSRYTLAQVDPLFRWRKKDHTILRFGPSLQLYNMKAEDNKGRFILNHTLQSYDSATLTKSKAYLGAIFAYEKDSRNHAIFPSKGGNILLLVKGYRGLNSYSQSLIQATSDITFYLPLNQEASAIVANRVGGGVTLGHAAFYQSLFLGGNDNLRGFRNYRFAGNHTFYNNLELRLRMAQIGSYILPGQLGATLFYDIGKVWPSGSNKALHQGVGGGLYYAPANIAVFQLLAGYSREGWYPHFAMGFRF